MNDQLKLSRNKKSAGDAMFAAEETSESWLRRIGSSKATKDLRVFLTGGLPGGGVTIDSSAMWNRFHDSDDHVSGGFTSINGGTTGGLGDSGDYDFDCGYEPTGSEFGTGSGL